LCRSRTFQPQPTHQRLFRLPGTFRPAADSACTSLSALLPGAPTTCGYAPVVGPRGSMQMCSTPIQQQQIFLNSSRCKWRRAAMQACCDWFGGGNRDANGSKNSRKVTGSETNFGHLSLRARGGENKIEARDAKAGQLEPRMGVGDTTTPHPLSLGDPEISAAGPAIPPVPPARHLPTTRRRRATRWLPPTYITSPPRLPTRPSSSHSSSFPRSSRYPTKQVAQLNPVRCGACLLHPRKAAAARDARKGRSLAAAGRCQWWTWTAGWPA
jgi:hypothetical protein